MEDKWETGELGRDETFVGQVAEEINKEVDEALELQLISIRLQKSLIEDLKTLARLDGIGYQPLIRQILNKQAERFLKERSE